jgi:hypothetical protein
MTPADFKINNSCRITIETIGIYPRITRSMTAMIAITNKMWIIPPTWKAKNPTAQPMIKIIAIR